MTIPATFIPLRRTLQYWPEHLFGADGGQLDLIGLTDYRIQSEPTQTRFIGTLAWLEEIELSLPGLAEVSIAFLSAGAFTQLPFEIRIRPDFLFSLSDVSATLRIRSPLLRRVKSAAGKWVVDLASNSDPKPTEVELHGVAASVSADGDISLTTGQAALSLSPFEIGTTGIVVEATQIGLYLNANDAPPTGAQPGFKGVAIEQANIHLTGSLAGGGAPSSVQLTHVLIGSSGFSGRVAAIWNAGMGTCTLFGVPCELLSLSMDFAQNAPVGGGIKARITLPFFEQPMEVEIGYTVDGGLTVGLGTANNGLATLHIANVLDLELDSLTFTVDHGLLTMTVSGMLVPTLNALKCPPIRIDNLEINSKGEVNLPGGWLAMPRQFGLEFHSFKIEITKIGFGRETNGDKWVGFSGGIKLVDGLPAGVSVDGLRITSNSDWSATPRVTLKGVGVELAIKDVLYFKGAVALREVSGGTRFDGAIRLELKSLDFRIDGQFVVGNTSSYRYMALYVGVDLPIGLPIASTGIAAYGMAGLFALRMSPNRGPSEPWYGVGPGQGWYKRNQAGVVPLADKWDPEPGSKALGIGLTFGTFPNSSLFNGRALFVGIFPGPILMLEGAANIAKDRAKLSDDPLFRSLAVFDNRAGSLLIGLDVTYRYDTTGKLIKLSAGTEAYYEFNDPTAWRINIGLDTPTESRIQADVFNLFQANAYVMLSPRRFAMGAWVGYSNHWKFGPLKLGLEAWMESNVLVSFKPVHFYGDIALHGAVDLEAFGFGLSLTVDASVEAEVFQPKHLLAQLDVTLNLPAPLPKKRRRLTAHCQIEFGPEPAAPPIPVALRGVSIEHMKVSTTWPLTSLDGLLQPVVSDSEGFLTTASGNIDALPGTIPVVPLDARPSLHFGHNMHDEALVGATVQIPDPAWEWIGDPQKHQGSARVRYALVSVVLDKRTGTSWTSVAGKGDGAGALPELFGSWTPAAANGGDGVAQDRLLLWSQCGFDSLRNTGMAYGNWFAGAFGGPQGYPCIAAPAASEMCLGFSKLPLGPVTLPFAHPDHPGVVFDSPKPGGLRINEYQDGRLRDKTPGVRALCATGGGEIHIHFADPAEKVMIHTLGPPPPVGQPQVTAESLAGLALGVALTRDASNLIELERNTARVDPGQVSRVELRGPRICLTEICGRFAATPQTLAAAAAGLAHNQSAAALWSGVGNVLEPHTIYRLRVTTHIDVAGFAYDSAFNGVRKIVQAAFFRTEGPPGLAQLSIPLEPPGAAAETALDDLGLYVKQTIPPTVPPRGHQPLLPRPVYRAYDTGVTFNVDYVDQMYRMSGRDLSLILYDRNNKPVRGRNGGVAIADNPWGVAESLSLEAHEESWLAMIAANECVPDLDRTTIAQDLTLAAAAEVLAPDMLYQARLVPSSLHEDFARIAIGTGRWHPHDFTSNGGASAWAIGHTMAPVAANLVQTGLTGAIGVNSASLGTAAVLGADPVAPAFEGPVLWTDYRVGASLRADSGAAIGLAFRWQDNQSFYLFAMDQTAGRGRTLYRASGGALIALAHDGDLFVHGRDYAVVIEAIGGTIKVWVDRVLVFDVGDAAPIPSGTIAMHCSNAAGAVFSDVRVHDLSTSAKPVYSFSFTTSCFVNFAHHVHSHDDDAWSTVCSLSTAALAQIRSVAVATGGVPISDQESRAFDELADDILGTRSRQEATRTETYRVASASGDLIALMVRSPEPFDHTRMAMSLTYAAGMAPASVAPAAVKLIGATLGAAQPADEEVTLMVRAAADLTGWSLQLRDTPAPDPVPLDDPESAWSTIYTFGHEEPMADATIVRIHSGPPTGIPDIPRTKNRYRADVGDAGDLNLMGDCVDLRLVGPAGYVEHARRFFSSTVFVDAPFLLLRKADGTAFVMLPNDGTLSLPVGAMKISLEYRRDNSASMRETAVLSEAGAKLPELAQIHIPTASPIGS